ncbi:GNAT family N-acetyltransferase [Aeromicrobium sp. CTD01-1L150]|uniref:GNAT family N-acetyltransferase n=1 Tax=Aeromicrobium sp. CTD01-1L150 TaxID=3341830 RepID=UPI0035C07D90
MSQTVPDRRSALSEVRALEPADKAELCALLDRDPAVNVFVRHRVDTTGLHEGLLGGRIWGYHEDGVLVSACHAGANVVPVEATPAAIDAFAERLLIDDHRAASVVGPREQVDPLWRLLAPHWGPARSPRPVQPFLELNGPTATSPDLRLRRVMIDEFELLYPACVAMFREEVGVDPEAGGALNYRARVSQLIASGWSFAIIEDDRVLFKAEVGAATAQACQIQGVWVHPDLRGTGLSAGALAAMVDQVRLLIAPIVTLYVNERNVPARALYERVGFTQTATFASYLL